MKTIKVKKYSNHNTSGNLQIVRLNEYLSQQAMIEKIHRHHFYFVLVIEKGSGKHDIDFISYDINNYSVFLLRPGQVHSIKLNKGSKGFLVTFDKAFYTPTFQVAFFEHTFRQNVISVGSESLRQIKQVLNEVFSEYNRRLIGYKEAIKAHFDVLFILLYRNVDMLAAPKVSFELDIFEHFLQLVETHIAHYKKTEFYAEKLNVSTYQLNAITKKLADKTSTQVITDQIILEAKRNLLATSLQIKEIAHILGYEDHSYFIRFFKKQTQLTPKAFRELHCAAFIMK
ncbi:AraC family transcriptional regulator [Marinifilum sp.]|uniref:AraC family transcriptional regulator n=1 Tax=Marinifilum sp. TaxID=2033137 RepID=UPI003BACFEBD